MKQFKPGEIVYFDRGWGKFVGPASDGDKQRYLRADFLEGCHLNWIVKKSGQIVIEQNGIHVVLAPVHLARISPKTNRLVLGRFVGYTETDKSVSIRTASSIGNYWTPS